MDENLFLLLTHVVMCVMALCVCQQYKILNVPLSSHLAANHFNQQQAEQEERMRMKKLTLDINERQEQEDYQGTSLANRYSSIRQRIYEREVVFSQN